VLVSSILLVISLKYIVPLSAARMLDVAPHLNGLRLRPRAAGHLDRHLVADIPRHASKIVLGSGTGRSSSER
jgi:hypothetical protein